MDSKVFGVIIGFNFFFTLEYKFNDCKHVVEVAWIQRGSTGGENANWGIDHANW